MKKIFKEMNKIENKLIEYFTPSKIFIVLMVGFMAGIFLGDLVFFDKEKDTVLFIIIILFFIIAYFWQKYFLVKMLSILSAVFMMGLLYFGAYYHKTVPKNLPYNQNIIFEGVVDDEPDASASRIKYTFKVIFSQNKEIINQKVLVTANRFPEYKYGDKLKISGGLEKPTNFNTFKYDKYLSRYNIYSLIKQPTNVEYIDSGNSSKIYNYLFVIKSKIISTINQILPEPESSLLAGLLVGARQNIPENIMEIFNKVGITHIIAISGFNITIIILALDKLLFVLSRKTRFLICLLILFSFVVITAATASVVRAAIMGSLFLFAGLIGRQKNLLTALFFVAFIMILINPFILKYDVGFQLSFLATLGLIIIAPIIEKYLEKKNKIIKETLSATLAAQILTIPLIIYYFGRFSIIAPLANILILPIIPTTMFLGFITSIIGVVSITFGRFVGLSVWLFLKYIIFVSELVSKIPYSSIEIVFNQWYVLIIFYLAIIMIYLLIKKRNRIYTTVSQ